MIARIRKALSEKESGFTLVELLVVVIIIGILAAIAIPLYMNQKQKGYDATVKSDLKNAVTSFETYLTSNSEYPDTSAELVAPDWSFNKSSGNTIKAYVVASGTNAGYVVVGKNANSENWFYISSYQGSSPVLAGATEPVPAAGGTGGVPTGATLSAALNL